MFAATTTATAGPTASGAVAVADADVPPSLPHSTIIKEESEITYRSLLAMNDNADSSPPATTASPLPVNSSVVVDDATKSYGSRFGVATAEDEKGPQGSEFNAMALKEQPTQQLPWVDAVSPPESLSLPRRLPRHQLFDIPIVVVGYAFSEKKMSTMGVVMAEASRTKLPWPIAEPSSGCGGGDESVQGTDATYVSLSSSTEVPPAARVQSDGAASDDDHFQVPDPILAQHQRTGAANAVPVRSNLSMSIGLANTHDKVVFSLQSGGYQTLSGSSRQLTMPGSNATTGNTTHTTPLHHVVRCFRSSCSSIHDDAEMRDDSAFDGDTDSASSMHSISSTHGYMGWPGRAVSASSGLTLVSGPCRRRRSSGSSSRSTSTTVYHRSSSVMSTSAMPTARRIAFVPIDLDQPIDEQHGGRMDIILHKLTEDILCLSQIHGMPQSAADLQDLTPSQQSALQRVRNLQEFSKKTGCCLLDHPDHVRTVMQRDTISAVLEGCLQDVVSRSGARVSTPKWTVVNSSWSYEHIEQYISAAGLTYPLIVKPLVAAGRSASHSMAVVSNPTGLVQFVSSSADRDAQGGGDDGGHTQGSKFLCQEYSNHDEALYKVYVLGSHVSVHRRRSLPNLPDYEGSEDDAAPTRLRDVVEFDSQRPYPRLSDFVVPTACEVHDAHEVSRREYKKKRPRHDCDAVTRPRTSTGEAQLPFQAMHDKESADVTVEDLGPVVDAIRRAFGLDLFGFDVLVAAPSAPLESSRWLVVDVNYFPSYKEVSNFPSLLAKYLTERALNDRTHGKVAAPELNPDSFR